MLSNLLSVGTYIRSCVLTLLHRAYVHALVLFLWAIFCSIPGHFIFFSLALYLDRESTFSTGCKRGFQLYSEPRSTVTKLYGGLSGRLVVGTALKANVRLVFDLTATICTRDPRKKNVPRSLRPGEGEESPLPSCLSFHRFFSVPRVEKRREETGEEERKEESVGKIRCRLSAVDK